MTDADSPTTEETETGRNWKSGLWKLANVLGLVLLIAIVIPFVVFTVPQVVGGSHSYVVLSGSMEPVMSPGDVVIVDDVPAEQIEEGNIITFSTSGDDRQTTHRVIEVSQQGGSPAFQTKGDANEDPDGALVSPEDVQGQVMSFGGHLFVFPYIGYVINFANTRLGFVLLFAVPITLFVLNEISNLIVASRVDTPSGGEAGSASEAVETDTSDATGSDTAEQEMAPSSVETGSSEPSDGRIEFTAAELQLGLLLLAAFLAYSVWVAYQTLEFWSFGVAGGVASAFLLLAGLYFLGGSSGDTADEEAHDSPPSGTESESDAGSDSDAEPEPVSTGEASGTGAETEASTSAESPAIDPEVELNPLEDIVGQEIKEDGSNTPSTASSGIEPHLSDGETPPVAADDDQKPSVRNSDRTADATGDQEEGENDD